MEQFNSSDLVVVSKPSKEFTNNKQRLNNISIIKGNLAKKGLYLSQQKGSCRYDQLPIRDDKEVLLFIKKTGDEYKLNKTCYPYQKKGAHFELKLNNNYAQIHKKMLSSFFKEQGRALNLELYISHRNSDTGTEHYLNIKNLEQDAVEIFHPSNRKAFSIFITDEQGNTLLPKGMAKVSPKGGTLTIPGGGVFNYKTDSKTGLYFPHLTDTGLFGFNLEKNKDYFIHVVYRPYGGAYQAVSLSEKKRVY
jgi:hypothetical protein